MSDKIAEIYENFRNSKKIPLAGPDTGVFTDGGASPNPGRGGWGYVYVRDNKIIDGGYTVVDDTTNNRMELTALIKASNYLIEQGIKEEVNFYSDSNLVVQTINTWAAGWKQKGWKRKTGPIANLELVKALYASFEKSRNFKLNWIKAHNGWHWNEFADYLSNYGR